MPETNALPLPRPAPVTLAALAEELLWPRLLRAPAYALRLDRLIPAFLGIVAIALVGSLSSLWIDGPGFVPRFSAAIAQGFTAAASSLTAFDPSGAIDALRAAFIDGASDAFSADPWGAAILLPVALALWMVVGGGISRSVACDFAAGVRLSWPAALAFGVQRAASLVMSAFLPLAVTGLIVLALAAGGWALFGLPVLDIAGAILYPLMAIGGVIAVIILVGLGLGAHLLAPAIACEGTDAIDAIQRMYNYVIHRPLVLIVYLLIGTALGACFIAAAAAILTAGIDLVTFAAGAWNGERGRSVLAGQFGGEGDAHTATYFVGLWRTAAVLVIAAVAMSFYFSFSTLMYLFTRQRNDLQHFSEVWFPGVIEGTLAAELSPPAAKPGDEDAD